MENVNIRPEAIKINVSSNEELNKQFIFELEDREVKLNFKLSERDIDECLSNQGLVKLAENFPDFFDKLQFNEHLTKEAVTKYPTYFEDGYLKEDKFMTLYEKEPDWFVENQIKKEFNDHYVNLILASVVNKALDSKENQKELRGVGSYAMTAISEHIYKDKDVTDFFVICGLYTVIS